MTIMNISFSVFLSSFIQMPKITALHLLIYFTSLLLIDAYTPLPVTIEDPRIKVLPKLLSSSSFVYNDAAYLYGGFYTDYSNYTMSSTMYRYDFIEETATLELSIVNTTNTGPKCESCTIYPILNTTKIYLLGYKEPYKPNVSLPLFQPYVFDFSTLTWTNLTGTAIYNGGVRGIKAFEYRQQHSSVLVKNSLIYILGGKLVGNNRNTTGYCARSVVYYNINTNSFNVLDKDAPECRLGANSFVTER